MSAGMRGVGRYTGTVFAVFLVQALVAAACLGGVALALEQAYARNPLFDEAVDGNLVALVWILKSGTATSTAVIGIASGTLLLWLVASWFLAGGLYGVLAQRPETREETVRAFGHGGAQTFLAYARLAPLSLPGLVIAGAVFGACTQAALPRIEAALTVPQLVGPLVLAIVPGALVLHVVWTIADYARVELALRHATHRPSVFLTYVRTVTFVLRRPMLLAHGALGWLLFGLVTGAYALIAHGHPMYGTEGALTLYVARSCVALIRMAIRVGVMGGQTEVGRTRALPPPRQAGPKGDATAAA